MNSGKKNFILLCLVLCASLQAMARTEIRELEKFDKISLAINADLILEKGNQQLFEIEGDDELLQHIITEVKDNKLIIKLDKAGQKKSWRNQMAAIRIQLPSLYALEVLGSGRVKSDDSFPAEEMELAISGSGDIRMPVEADRLDLMVTGSGRMQLRGVAQNANVRITGSGNVEAEELEGDRCEVKISGSGNCRIHVSESLDARITGSGIIYYSGSPESVTVKTTGSGRVKKAGK